MPKWATQMLQFQLLNLFTCGPTPTPCAYAYLIRWCGRPMFSGMGKAAAKCSIAFVSQLSVENVQKHSLCPCMGLIFRSFKGEVLSYGLSKRVEAVQGCRAVKKGGMKFNNTLPQVGSIFNELAPLLSLPTSPFQIQVKVDPESYQVVVDGQLLSCEPAGKLPLSQRFFLF